MGEGTRNFAGGICFTGRGGGGWGVEGIAQGILSIFRGFCDALINIPYIYIEHQLMRIGIRP